MSTTQTPEKPAHDAGAQPHVHGHPTPLQYVQIFAVLFVLTALEVLASYVALPEALFIGGLAAMAIAKFSLVVGFYMHLRFDNRMFRRLFVFGIVLAATVFALVLTLFFVLTPTYGGTAT